MSARCLSRQAIVKHFLPAILLLLVGCQLRADTEFATVTSDGLRLRDRPDTGSTVLGELHTDTVLLLVESTGERSRIGDFDDYWWHVKTVEGIEGWVFGAYLKRGVEVAGSVARFFVEDYPRKVFYGYDDRVSLSVKFRTFPASWLS